jgi:ribonuclease BN (tRNA processing enzyme)
MAEIKTDLTIFPIVTRKPTQLFIHFLPDYEGDTIIIQIPKKTTETPASLGIMPAKTEKTQPPEISYTNILIDCAGFDDSIAEIIRKRLQISEIHYIIITHGDKDHILGIEGIISNFGLGNPLSKKEYQKLFKPKKKGTNTDAPKIGSSIPLQKIYLPDPEQQEGSFSCSYKALVKRLQALQTIISSALLVYPSKDEGGLKIGENVDITKNDEIKLVFQGPKEDFFKLEKYNYNKLQQSEKSNNTSLLFKISYKDRNYLLSL